MSKAGSFLNKLVDPADLFNKRSKQAAGFRAVTDAATANAANTAKAAATAAESERTTTKQFDDRRDDQSGGRRVERASTALATEIAALDSDYYLLGKGNAKRKSASRILMGA